MKCTHTTGLRSRRMETSRIYKYGGSDAHVRRIETVCLKLGCEKNKKRQREKWCCPKLLQAQLSNHKSNARNFCNCVRIINIYWSAREKVYSHTRRMDGAAFVIVVVSVVDRIKRRLPARNAKNKLLLFLLIKIVCTKLHTSSSEHRAHDMRGILSVNQKHARSNRWRAH